MAPLLTTVAPSLISGGLSLLGGLFGSSSASAAQRQQMEWQEKMWQKQADWSAQQAEINRDFQSAEAEKLRDYNSIVNQMRRAQQAGVNPYSLVQGSSYGSSSSAQPAGAIAGLPSMPQPASDPFPGRASGFNSVAASLDTILNSMIKVGEAKKLGLDTSLIESTFNDMVKKAHNEAIAVQLSNGIQKIVLKYKDKITKQELEKLTQEVYKIVDEDWLIQRQWSLTESQIVGNLAKAGIDKQMARQIAKYVDEFMSSDYASQIAQRYSVAHASESQVQLNASLRKLNDLAYDVRFVSSEEEKRKNVQQYINEAKQAGILSSIMEQQLERAVRNNDWQTVEKIFGLIESATRSFGNVIAPARLGGNNSSRDVSAFP